MTLIPPVPLDPSHLSPCSTHTQGSHTEIVDLSFVLTSRFAYKVGIIVAISSFPLYIFNVVRKRLRPAAYAKVAGI